MSDISVIKNQSGFFPYPMMEKHGKLSYELGVNKKDTLARIAGDIHKAALVMGISVDGEKSVLTASEALKKIVEVFPTAWVEDISKAIEMASFGQIKLPDQLNTISAANIFQWYRELRINHPDKIGHPMESTYKVQNEPTPAEKFNLMAESFAMFLKDPKKHEMASAIYYDRFVKMGIMDYTPEIRISLTILEVEKLLKNYPLDIYNDRLRRKQANEFRAYFYELPEPKKVNWVAWGENPIVMAAISTVKRGMVLESIEFYGEDELISNYKKQIADELQIEIPRSN
jgi:hypothetical protein